MGCSSIVKRASVILLWLPLALWPQASTSDKSAEMAQRETMVDQVRSNQPKRRIDPDGHWQMDKIVKAQYDQLTADTEKLTKLSAELRSELNDPNVLSAGSMKKAEEIEKLAKKVRSRLRGWF